MKRLVVPIVLTFVIAIPLILMFESVDLTPVLASQQGRDVDQLLRILFILASLIFGGVMAFLLYSVVAFRRQPGDTSDAEPIHGHTGLEITWTVIPLIIVIALGVIGTDALLNIHQSPTEQDLVVNVTGFQWAWRFEYPEYNFDSTELVLPVERPVLFKLTSQDVNHSFFIPEFRIKMDALPGIVNEVRLTPTQIGEYRTYCAELCGTSHAYMIARVRVVDQATFERWVQERKEAVQDLAGQAAEGRQVYQDVGCVGCHSIDGSQMTGPTLLGLYNSQRTFADGTTATADEAYLRTSILEPGAQIVQGFANQMPANYAEQLDEAQIEALIEFIKSLE